MKRGTRYAVAASGQWTDEEDGRRRMPAGEVHAWEPGRKRAPTLGARPTAPLR
ncbi:hypothetical protein ACFW5X_09275 [Streptomyces albogriseolus]|uniref:hypothetical protein n=1 Tax=Streptomyces albogriseolus TaxID=1887 RepID=UPI0036AC4E6C